MPARFFHLTLRTTDVDAARAFYAALLDGGVAPEIVALHPQALARGARPHWLGILEVADVDAATEAFVARGATPLGPKWVNPSGLEAAVLRDPGGAVVAVGRAPAPSGEPVPRVAWSLLHTEDVERAKVGYAALFGWALGAPVELAPHGAFHPFAWELGAPPAGAMTDVAGRVGVHPHWLFHFEVEGLDAAIAAVRENGGLVADVVTLTGGERIAVCEDAQGAAFALRESARA